jgi:hypothetical protein
LKSIFYISFIHGTNPFSSAFGPMVRNVKERLNQVPIAIGMEGLNGLAEEANCSLTNP